MIYLSPDWRPEWGATTRFLDVSARQVLETRPAPGRVVLLDQDVVHRVSAPTAAAGRRARFSLVLKLVVHPSDGARVALHRRSVALRAGDVRPLRLEDVNM